MGESWCFSCPSCDLGHLWAAVFLELLLRREDQQKTQYQCVKGIFSQIWKCSTSAGDGLGCCLGCITTVVHGCVHLLPKLRLTTLLIGDLILVLQDLTMVH